MHCARAVRLYGGNRRNRSKNDTEENPGRVSAYARSRLWHFGGRKMMTVNGAAAELLQRYIPQIDAMWWRNRHHRDVLGMLQVDGLSWCLSMDVRKRVLDETPAILLHLPQIGCPAWEAIPELATGTAMWFLVGLPCLWTCLRVQTAIMRTTGSGPSVRSTWKSVPGAA